MYLYGSLALGAFDYDSSDIDFLVVTEREIREEQLAALVAFHDDIAANNPTKWATELEGSYIPKAALRRYNPDVKHHPHIDRDVGERLRVQPHDIDWVLQYYVLREHGITLDGPLPKTLIDPISPHDLRDAVRELMSFWWEPMGHDPAKLQHGGYRSYAVMTMCRMLYTAQHGTVTSKTEAIAWAQNHLPERWSQLVILAGQHRNGSPLVATAEAQAFIRYTSEQLQKQ